MNKIIWAGAIVTTVFVGGCGGGGSASESSNAVSRPLHPLAAYIGTWNKCWLGSTTTYVFAEGAQPGTLSLSASVKHRAPDDRNCTGPVVMVETYQPASTLVYVGTVSAKMLISGKDPLNDVKVDKATIANPARIATITGPDVRAEPINGGKGWCAYNPEGIRVMCQSEPVALPAEEPGEVGFYRVGNQMYWAKAQAGAETTYAASGGELIKQP